MKREENDRGQRSDLDPDSGRDDEEQYSDDYTEEDYQQFPFREEDNDEEDNEEEEEEMDLLDFDLEIDPIEFLIFTGLHQLGMTSILTTSFLTGMVEGGIISLPVTGAYSTTVALLDRNKDSLKKFVVRDVLKDMSRRSLAVGIFFGSFIATSEAVEHFTQTSNLAQYIISGVTSVPLATIAFRKPKLVLPGIGFLLGAAFMKILP